MCGCSGGRPLGESDLLKGINWLTLGIKQKRSRWSDRHHQSSFRHEELKMRHSIQALWKRLRRSWQYAAAFWRRLFGKWIKRSRASHSGKTVVLKPQPRAPLTPVDYEFLFTQLLEGVHRGWTQMQVLQFIKGLGYGQYHNTASSVKLVAKNEGEEKWVEWLREFGDRLLESPIPNRELATRMVQLGQLNCGTLAEVAGEIGQQLLDRPAQIPQPIDSATNSISDKPEDRVEKWVSQGQAQLDRRQYPSALTSFQQAAQLTSQSPEVFYGLAVACHRMGLYREAIAHLDCCLDAHPGHAPALTQRGLAYQALQEREKATADFEQVVEMAASSPQSYCARGKALVQLQRQEEAVAAYEEAIRVNPTSHHAWYNLGNVLYDLQRYEAAIECYDKAIELQPDYAAGWFNRGAALGNLQRYEAAIAAFDRVLQVQPHDYDAWLCRGQTLERLACQAEAIAAYDRALELRPDDPTAWRYRTQASDRLKNQ